MKRFIALLASAVLLASLCACGSDPSSVNTPAPDAPTPSQAVPSDTPDVTPDITPAVVTATPSPSPSPSSAPVVERIPEPDRPVKSEIAVYYGGNSSTVPAELVVGSLSDSVGLCFSLYSDTEAYEHVREVNSHRFNAVAEKGDADELSFMELLFIDGATTASLAPSFMDIYLSYDEIEFSASRAIGPSKLRCETIVAYNAEQYVAAYLYERSGGVAAFVISCSTDGNDYHRPRLTAMLDTLVLFDLAE